MKQNARIPHSFCIESFWSNIALDSIYIQLLVKLISQKKIHTKIHQIICFFVLFFFVRWMVRTHQIKSNHVQYSSFELKITAAAAQHAGTRKFYPDCEQNNFLYPPNRNGVLHMLCCGLWIKLCTSTMCIYPLNACVRALSTHSMRNTSLYICIWRHSGSEWTWIRIRNRIHHVKLCEKESLYCRLRSVDVRFYMTTWGCSVCFFLIQRHRVTQGGECFRFYLHRYYSNSVSTTFSNSNSPLCDRQLIWHFIKK